MDPNQTPQSTNSLPPLPQGAQVITPEVTVVQPTTPAPSTSSLNHVDHDKRNLMSMAKWIFVIVLGLALVFLVGSVIFYVLDDGGKIAHVRVTNLSPNSATITWTTEKEVKGRVLWGADNNWLPFILQTMGENINYDDRDLEQLESGFYRVSLDSEGSRITHHVTLRNLEPEVQYFFKVGSGTRYFDADVISFKTKPVTDDIKTPDVFYGKVNEPEHGENVNDAIVYYQLQQNNGTYSSSYYSVPVVNGTYSGDIGYLSQDDGAYYTYKADETTSLVLETLAKQGGSRKSFPLLEYKPLPPLVVDPDFKPEGSNNNASLLKSVYAGSSEGQRNDDCDGKSCGDGSCDHGPNDDGGYFCHCGNVTTTNGPCFNKTEPDKPLPQDTQSPQPTQAPGGDQGNPPVTVHVNNDCSNVNCGTGSSCYTGPNENDGGYQCLCSGGEKSGLDSSNKQGYCNDQTAPTQGGIPPVSPNNGSVPEGSQCGNGVSCSVGRCLACGNCTTTNNNRCAGYQVTCDQICSAEASGQSQIQDITTINNEATINLEADQVAGFNAQTWAENVTNETCSCGPICGGKLGPNGSSTTGTTVNCRYPGGGTATFSPNGEGRCQRTSLAEPANCAAVIEEVQQSLEQTMFIGIPPEALQPQPTLSPSASPSITGDGESEANCPVGYRDFSDFDAGSPSGTCTNINGVTLKYCKPSDSVYNQTTDILTCNGTVQGVSDSRVLGASSGDTIEPGVYTITGLDNFEISIVGDNVRVTFFEDTNRDGIKQEQEKIIDLQSFNIALSKSETVAKYALNNGWNLIGFEFVSEQLDKASEVIGEINIQGVIATHLATYSDGKWLMYSARVNSDGKIETFGDDYSILPGRGYFVKTSNSGNVNFTGRSFAEAVPLSLANGWNLLTVQSPTSYTAEAFIDKCVNAQMSCDSVARFDSGLYEVVVKDAGTLFGNNFNLIKKSGYFVRVKDGGGKTVTP